MANVHYERDIFRQLQESMERIGKLESTITEMKETQKEEVVILNKRIEGLEKENTLLREDNERMKSILNNDSNNSSKPPSSDPKGKRANEYNDRKKSSQPRGGQKGHTGKTLTGKDIEAKIASGEYQHKVVSFGSGTGKYIKKYEIDLQIIPVAREMRFYADGEGKYNIPQQYRSDVTYGPILRSLALELYSVGVVSNDRICEFLNCITQGRLAISEGSIYNFCRGFAGMISGDMGKIRQELLNAKVVYTDATVVSTDGHQVYIRNQSTAKSVLYSAMEKKDIETLKKTGILAKYTGTFVHDHEPSLYHFGGRHGECNVHILRYLEKNNEDTGNTWSKDMAQLLRGMNKARKARMQSYSAFRPEELDDFKEEYDQILHRGQEENKTVRCKWARREERSLVNRMEKYKENHLLFLHDFDVNFDNNMSERDLRKCKNRQKMSGGFRTMDGCTMYCNILSFVETCKRRGLFVFDCFVKAFRGLPVLA